VPRARNRRPREHRGFVTQELPIPTLGFEARQRLTDRLSGEGLLLPNGVNNVNSVRHEGGTVYL